MPKQLIDLPISVLYRTNYVRRPQHIVPRFTDETKDNFFIATLAAAGFVVEVEGDDVSPSPSQTVAITKLILNDVRPGYKHPVKLRIRLKKFIPDGYVRRQIKVMVERKDEQFHYQIDSRGNQF